jgi:hypothetical protein
MDSWREALYRQLSIANRLHFDLAGLQAEGVMFQAAVTDAVHLPLVNTSGNR